MYSNQDEMLSNLLNAFSVILGYTNLQENRIQSAQNDVNSANDRQANYLLQELDRRFQEQTDLLMEQTALLKSINTGIKILLLSAASASGDIDNNE